jgi:hypothetical protein
MDRKPYTIIFALILIGSFFLPCLKFGTLGSASGFDIVTATGGKGGDWQVMLLKYIWILIPLSGILLLIGALNNENYFLGRGLWTWLPLLTVIFIIVKFYLDAKNNGSGSVSLGDLVKIFGVGYWIAFGASLILAFYNPRSR